MSRIETDAFSFILQHKEVLIGKHILWPQETGMLVVQWNIVGLKRNVEEDNIDAALVCEDRLREYT